jgi:hypothetical protein
VEARKMIKSRIQQQKVRKNQGLPNKLGKNRNWPLRKTISMLKLNV